MPDERGPPVLFNPAILVEKDVPEFTEPSFGPLSSTGKEASQDIVPEDPSRSQP
jgi:hypothetical protein